MSDQGTSYIFLPRNTRRRLHLLASGGMARSISQIADDIINRHIEANYPGILEVESKIIVLEKALAKELSKNGEQQ